MKQQYTSLYKRFITPEVIIGTEKIGAENPIAVQSMTNTNTNDINASVEQCIKIFDEGANYIRLTAQGVKEAQSLELIKKELVAKGYDKPLVADIHFNPKAALEAAKHVDKVRINPGNYISAKTKTEYTPEEFQAEIDKIKENILPLLEVCREHNTAIRIGVNHGSLSQRILSKYGDTPQGMVVSMMEFLKIFKEEGFKNVACSVKSSNTRSMIYAYRLLVETMQTEDCIYPIHLGVTEAGGGEDGRIKSAVGIGSLLLDGIGDTIRVSLTEAPEKEIPVCKDIVNYRDEVFANALQHKEYEDVRFSPYDFAKSKSHSILGIGADANPIVISAESGIGADWKIDGNKLVSETDSQIIEIVNYNDYSADSEKVTAVRVYEDHLSLLKEVSFNKNTIVLFTYQGLHLTAAVRQLYAELQANNNKPPVILDLSYSYESFDLMQIRSSVDVGSVFIDGFCDGILLNNPAFSNVQLKDLSFGILQASRARFSKTEFIACPSCGRTLFNIENSLQSVKEKTDHLKGLKIAVMGCIVNGPGEMADADYGYIGAGAGKVNLYRKQDLIKKGIDESEAVQALIDVIKDNGDWK